MIIEFFSALKSWLSDHISENQCVVKPDSGKAMTFESLNANKGSSTIGA